MAKVSYKTVHGLEVPRRARRLTRGHRGIMRDWYDDERKKMVSTLLYKKGQLVGWCAAVNVSYGFWIFRKKRFKISTFVQKNMRGRGYAKKLLEETLKTIKLIEPSAQILYGTPEDHDYFNDTYEAVITAGKLKPVRHYAI